ncbi:MAG: pyruvate, phosphate dikinase [Pseudomonadota bacterium]
MDDLPGETLSPGLTPLHAAAGQARRLGARADRLGQMLALRLPVPEGLVLDFDTVAGLAAGAEAPEIGDGLGAFVALRGSAGQRDWGGPQAMLNLGLTDASLSTLAARIGEAGALEAYRRAIRGYAVRVAGLDPEAFDSLYYDQTKLTPEPDAGALAEVVDASKALYRAATGSGFPQDPATQLAGALRAMAREWNAPTARLLREARGAPPQAGLALIVQRMVFGLGARSGGAGSFQPVDSQSGVAQPTGRYLPAAQGADAGRGGRSPQMITEAERQAAGQTAPTLESCEPLAFEELVAGSAAMTKGLGDVFEVQFTVEAGALYMLDAEPVRRSAGAAVQIAVDLAEAGAITRDHALLRIDPAALIETLHPRIDPAARRDVFATGLPASPGAATGQICFTPAAAMTLKAQGGMPVLVRGETSPEDIRGMHAAGAVLTVRGGMTSHAAVIARGLGLPCVVGARDLTLQRRKGKLTAPDGRVFREGDTITVDGTAGEVLAGAPPMLPALPTAAMDRLMAWADDVRSLGVRANADTPADAALARRFNVDGIGLCRTEHMFFDEGRIEVMREMILATDADQRRAALDRLLPMQRSDFQALFQTMPGLPVTIRLLDPPLHEFLPSSDEGIAALAEAMGLSQAEMRERTAELQEVNPMLGKRGVRLGITMPEIYDMQVRAILEAALAASDIGGAPVIPEIMIPLVSANREVELIKTRIEAVAAQVDAQSDRPVRYRVGVMVETPRGALRAGDLARSSAFLSFGTNDLTQMTYGLSRDDAGSFMRDYVGHGVFPEDPFHSLDLEGVGELLLMATRRGRAENPDLTLGLCGEHGGDPESIRFCQVAGFDYVSCSAFRVPIARLAAAQAMILAAG